MISHPLTTGPNDASTFWKHVLFIVGSILLLLPPWVIHTTLSESVVFEQTRRRQGAAELLETALHLARNQDLGRLLIVEQLEEESLKLAERISSDRMFDPASEMERIAARLGKTGSPPILAMSLDSRDRRIAAWGECTPGERDFFSRFLDLNVQGFFRSISASESQNISDTIPKFLGTVQTFSYFNHEMRGMTAQVIFRNKDAFLFWMPLINRNKATSMLRSPVSDTIFIPNTSNLKRNAKQQLIAGGILFVMPPPETGAKGIKSTIRRYARQGIRLAFIPEDGGPVTAHRSWLKAPLKACLHGARPPEGWVVSRGTVFAGKRYEILGAMQLPADSPGRGTREMLIRTLCWTAAILAILAWFSSLFRGGGLASGLGRQLTAGFLLAALFPLTTMFLIIEPYAAERHEVRVQEVRSELRNTISLIELQSLSHRPRLWDLISRLFKEREFLEAARKDAVGADPGARSDLERQLKQRFMYLFDKPFDISLRKMILAGTGTYVRAQARPGDAPGGASLLAELMNHNANEAIKARGGRDFTSAGKTEFADGERGSAAATKREMVWDVGREVFLSIIGPEVLFDWLNGKNEPILFEVGIGTVMLYEILLPGATSPEFLLTMFLKAEYHELNAMSRTLSGKWHDGPVFVFQRSLIGESCLPGTGERHPFLRHIARQVEASAKPLSLRLNDGGTSWLIEGVPGADSRHFVFTAIADEAPIRAETEAIRRRLTAMLLAVAFVTMLLAASATQDIVSPIKNLIEGIRAISAGGYSHRVPEDRSDELGEMAGAFNKMAHGLEERNILSRMVSGSALTSTTSSDFEREAREGRRQTAIVCFVSFTGAEAMMASMPPEDALVFLNRHVVIACRMLHEAGADIDKLLGQKILAKFPPELGMSAVRVARQLQNAHREGSLKLRPAIGLTLGPVISGILGSGDRRDHTIIGDTVNLAARAAALAEKFDPVAVVLDDVLHKLVKNIGAFESLGETMLKGKTRSVRLVRLLDSRRKKDIGTRR